MQRHESYKPSGVKWLGDVPSHWDVQALRAVTQLKSDRNQPDLPVLSVYREYGVIRKDSRDDNHNATSLDTSTYKVVQPGDLVVNKMKAWQGSMGVSAHEGIVSPAYITCATKSERVLPGYLHFLLRSSSLMGVYNSLSYGVRVGQWDMHYEDFKQIPIPLPSKDEQGRIVAFLDEKMAQIDAAIAKKVRLIELLKEQQNILIGRAATQGLGLGTDALPENRFESSPTPSHWKKLKLKYCVDLLPGFAFKSTAYTNDETDIPLLRGVNINPGQLNWRETVYWPRSKIEESSIYFLSAGDLVIGMDRPWVADGIRVAAISSEYLPCLLLQRVARLRAKAGVTQGYLELILTSKSFLSYFEPMLTGISVPHISHDQIGNFEARLPPLDEQEAICGHVSNIKKKYKMAVAHESKILESLIELKSTLVSEAVTGKIKV